MKKPAVDQSDKLLAITKDPELRAVVEHYFAVKPSEREPYGAFLEAFNEKADALYPDWQETREAAESDGRIVRALAIHCVLRILTRSNLDELEQFEAKTAYADFFTCFDEVTRAPNASAAFRMMLAFAELMRIAKLDPEEMEEIARQARRNNAVLARSMARAEKDWVQPVLNAAQRLLKHDRFMKSQTAAGIIKERMGEDCPDVRWVAQLIRDKRADGTLPLQQRSPARRPTRRR